MGNSWGIYLKDIRIWMGAFAMTVPTKVWIHDECFRDFNTGAYGPKCSLFRHNSRLSYREKLKKSSCEGNNNNPLQL